MEYNTNFKNLSSVLSKVKAGDKILIDDGTYPDVSLKISVKGTLDKRITIKAKNAGKAILTGKFKLTIDGSYVTFANFVMKDGGVKNGIELKGVGNRITGCDISFNSSDAPIVALYAKNNRLDHCIFQNFTKAGVWVEVKRTGALDYVLIDHNIFRNRSEGSGNGFEGIRIGTSGGSMSNSRTLVYSNLFDKVNGEVETISVKSSENIIYKNNYTNTKGTITLRHGNRSIVAKNRLLQNKVSGSGGIRIVGEDHTVYANLIKEANGGNTTGSGISITNGIKNSKLNQYLQVKNTEIVGNVLINNNCDFTIGLSKKGGTLQPIESEIKDNIVYKTSSDAIFSSKGSGSPDMKYENNKFYGKNFGSNPKNAGNLLKPTDFNISSINEKDYGTEDPLGPDWTKTPESTELGIEVNVFYDNIKNEILNDMKNKNNTVTKTKSVVIDIKDSDKLEVIESDDLTSDSESDKE